MDSIEYYNKYANLYYENTVELNMEGILSKFLELIPEGGSVLDLGCGSGRDSLFMIDRGFDVTALDGAEELAELASIHIGQDVLNMKFEEMDFEDVFDGVWACASLLHVSDDEIYDIMNKVVESLKTDGILYMSFKYGDFTGFRNQRFYNDYKSKKIKELLNKFKELEIIEIFKTDDVRKDKSDKVFINVLAKKNGKEIV